jgi:LmbE family N-acetylglucosaminyl deacetylase
MSGPYDVLAFGAHPDDLEAVMDGTAAKLVAKGRSVLFVDFCDGEPTDTVNAASGQRKRPAPPLSSVSIGTHCRFATD